MTVRLLSLTREKGEFFVNTVPVPATPLTILRNLCFTLLCCAVLMVFGAAAQTITVEQIKADPGNNDPPPTGAILDLSGTPIYGAYQPQSYSVNFTAAFASTAITFAFRNDPAFTSFANASVVDVTANNGINLLTNGDFSAGPIGSNTPTGWTYANNYGATFGGFVQSGCGDLSGNCWYDGAVQAYDAISQTIATNVGDTYQISFYVKAGGGSTFSDLSTNGNTTGTGGNGIDVTVYALQGLPPAANTLTVMEAGQGNGNVADGTEGGIYCTDTAGTVTGTCSTNYPNPTQVTLTATWDPTSTTTFGGWGGACVNAGMNSTCTLTMTSSQNVSAVFNAPGPAQGGQVNPGQPNPTVYTYNGGFSQDNPNSGYDFTGQETSQQGNQAAEVNVTALPQASQQACDAIVQANPLFSTAECFVYQNGGGPGVDAPVMFEVTCPGSGGTCGSSQNADFFATLGSDFSFTCTENSPLQCGPSPAPFSFGFPNLTSADGLPAIGFLKGAGPDPSNPCTPATGINPPPLFLSNQIISFNLVDPGSKPVTAGSGGTGSCWVVTYLTPGELPTVSIAAPVNNGTYTQGLATQANYTCNAVTTVTQNNPNPATGPYLTVASCTATDSPGGAVGQSAQFDTSTVGPHKFTAYVQDSATNTNSQTVTYTVTAPPVTRSANYATFMEGTAGSFTITTTGYPVPALTYSPIGSLPSGLTFVDNHNGTATISGSPTVSGVFTFWIKATNGVGTGGLQSFTLTVPAPVSVSPTSLAFGSVVIGQSAKKTVTVQNNSGKTLSIGPVTFTVTAGDKTQFSLGPGCPASLTAGNSCSITVIFTPDAAVTDAASLNIANSAYGSPLKVPITAAGKK